MKIIGIDLSGPSNHQDTFAAVFREQSGQLIYEHTLSHASDHDLYELVSHFSHAGQSIFIGIDAPLSIQDGGGDRPFDKGLRDFAKQIGMKPGSVMTPTMTRMIYLSARGMHLAHLFSSIPHVEQVIEVHPGASLISRLPEDHVRHGLQYKQENTSLMWVKEWLKEQHAICLPTTVTTHQLDACLAGLATWHWAHPTLEPTWFMNPLPPHHPFPICC